MLSSKLAPYDGHLLANLPDNYLNRFSKDDRIKIAMGLDSEAQNQNDRKIFKASKYSEDEFIREWNDHIKHNTPLSSRMKMENQSCHCEKKDGKILCTC